MRTLSMMAIAAAVLIGAHTAAAQTKTIPGKTEVLTVTVEGIDHSNRIVTVKKPDGTYDELYIPSQIKSFDTLKIGDKVTAKYYENVVLTVKPAGQPDVNKASAAVTRAEQGTAGTVGTQRTITATITAIDPSTPSITFSGPQGWKYSTRVQDKEALSKVKVGDKVDITWTEATVLSLEHAK
jgi:uncharacterized OB-fold protein